MSSIFFMFFPLYSLVIGGKTLQASSSYGSVIFRTEKLYKEYLK